MPPKNKKKAADDDDDWESLLNAEIQKNEADKPAEEDPAPAAEEVQISLYIFLKSCRYNTLF